MKDRISLYPGRVKLNPVAGEANTFDMVRADQPTQEGTALNKANLLSDSTATGLHLGGGEPTPDLAFQKMMKNVQVERTQNVKNEWFTWWEHLPKPGADAQYMFAVQETETFIGITTTGIVLSTDYGKTWETRTFEVKSTDYPLTVFWKNGAYYFVCKKYIAKSDDLKAVKKSTPVDANGNEHEPFSAVFDGENIVWLDKNGIGHVWYTSLNELGTAHQGVSLTGAKGVWQALRFCNGVFFAFTSGSFDDKIFAFENYVNGPVAENTSVTMKGNTISEVVYFKNKYWVLGAQHQYGYDGNMEMQMYGMTYSGGNLKIQRYDYVSNNSVFGSWQSTIIPRNGALNQTFFVHNNDLYMIGGGDNSSFDFHEITARLYKASFNESQGTLDLESYEETCKGYHLAILNMPEKDRIAIVGTETMSTYTTYFYDDKLMDMAGSLLELSNDQIPVHIETGSYTGTGTYGESNPNSLTFGFEPKFVLIYRFNDTAGNSNYCNATFSPIIKNSGIVTYQVGYSTSYSDLYEVKWEKNAVKWYNDESDLYQLNYSEWEYYYIAIG